MVGPMGPGVLGKGGPDGTQRGPVVVPGDPKGDPRGPGGPRGDPPRQGLTTTTTRGALTIFLKTGYRPGDPAATESWAEPERLPCSAPLDLGLGLAKLLILLMLSQSM